MNNKSSGEKKGQTICITSKSHPKLTLDNP